MLTKTQKSYGMDENTNLEEICKKVCICLGNGTNRTADKLLYEIMGVETGHGTIKDTTISSAGNGIFQHDRFPFEDNQSRYQLKYLQIIKEYFNIDMDIVKWEDLQTDILKGAIACRLHFKPFPEPIPKDIVGRARYWKRYYNTEAGKGTVHHYLEMNGYDMQYYHPSMEVSFND
jgi:hypothetical protein